jgi:hypothetical protein
MIPTVLDAYMVDLSLFFMYGSFENPRSTEAVLTGRVIAILYNKRKSLKAVGILAQESFKLRLSTVEAEAVRS